MRYAGGKGVSYRNIVNLIPSHDQYIETHLGGGAVMRNKRAAPTQIGIDLDPAVIALWRNRRPEICRVVQGDAIECLRSLPLNATTVIYADPPYHPDTRRRKRVYRFDYSRDDHERLLTYLSKLPCKVLISGYRAGLYIERLAGWSVHTFRARTHVDTREECVWFNFPRPNCLHDDRYIGNTFREREVIRRRQGRLRARVGRLSQLEQRSLHDWLGSQLQRGHEHDPENPILE